MLGSSLSLLVGFPNIVVTIHFGHVNALPTNFRVFCLGWPRGGVHRGQVGHLEHL